MKLAKAYIFVLLIFVSCLESAGPDRKKTKKNIETAPPSSLTGKGAQPGDGSLDSGNGKATGKVEIRHLVDPFDGAYKTKLTIPRNFSGLMYISGLNLTGLNERLVTVRFRFGRHRDAIVDIPASIGIGPGITGTANISVLILDMDDRPFEKVRLLYDLFDYNDYGISSVPTTDNRNNRLYCRGLSLEDDPTFEGTSGSCSASGDKCLYAFAKIRDSGLFDTSLAVETNSRPTEAQLDIGGSGYNSQSDSEILKKCLPDSGLLNFDLTGALYSLNTSGAGTSTPLSAGTLVHSVTDSDGNQTDYRYISPYFSINSSNWEISTSASVHDHINEADSEKATPRGIFMLEGTAGDIQTGYHSYMFPRAGKMKLSSGVQYVGGNGSGGASTVQSSYHVTGARALASLPSNGETEYMDGCSIRASNYNTQADEHIGSCNVSAFIQVLYIDQTGTEEVLAETKNVKLQLVPPSKVNNVGKEVLYSAMKSCTNSRSCASDECCYNNRCVGKDIVSQCKEDVTDNGNFGIGQSCSSDFQCTSLCCNSATSTCAVHDNNLDPEVLCQKPPNDYCVATPFCQQVQLEECFIVKGSIISGVQKCSLRCYPKTVHSKCINSRCVPPPPPSIPIFDSGNPDCSQAIDPPVINDID